MAGIGAVGRSIGGGKSTEGGRRGARGEMPGGGGAEL